MAITCGDSAPRCSRHRPVGGRVPKKFVVSPRGDTNGKISRFPAKSTDSDERLKAEQLPPVGTLCPRFLDGIPRPSHMVQRVSRYASSPGRRQVLLLPALGVIFTALAGGVESPRQGVSATAKFTPPAHISTATFLGHIPRIPALHGGLPSTHQG